MTSRLFIGSLSFNVDDNQLKKLFSTVGEVVSASVISDKYSGQSKGYAFVEMASEDKAKVAIKLLNNKEIDGRSIVVSEAKPREDKPQRQSNNYQARNRNSESKRHF